MHKFVAIVFTAFVFLSSTASASTPSECMPVVKEGWIRLLPVDMPMLAGFGRVQNDCLMPITIVRIRSSAFESVELHETSIVAGVSRMRPLPELKVANQATVALKPGGMHLMLMRPRAALTPGGKTAIEFELSDGRVLIGEFEAKRNAP